MSRHALEVPPVEPRHRDDRKVDAPSRAPLLALSAEVRRRLELEARAEAATKHIEAGQVYVATDLAGDGPVYAYDSRGRLIGELGERVPVTPPPLHVRYKLPPFLEESMRVQNPDHPRSRGW